MTFGSTTTAFLPNQDMIDVREKGYIGKFKSYPVVVLPQSVTDALNTAFVMDPGIAYVMPAGKEKVVYVGFEGNTIVDEFKNRDRGIEIQAYKKMSVAVVGAVHSWGIYQNSDLTGTGFSSLS
jgi:hypothetical protein